MTDTEDAPQAQLNFSGPSQHQDEISTDAHGNVYLRCNEHSVGIRREAIVSVALKILRIGGYGDCGIAHATACGFIWVRREMTPEDIVRIDEEHERQREAEDAELYKHFEPDGTPRDRTAAERMRRYRERKKAKGVTTNESVTPSVTNPLTVTDDAVTISPAVTEDQAAHA